MATLDQITTAVAEHLTAHPPQPGRPPTDAEIDAAVARYLTANPPPAGPRGPQGEQGERGEPGLACPAGYDLRPVLLLAPDGNTYSGVGCVEPGSATPPDEPSDDGGLIPTPSR